MVLETKAVVFNVTANTHARTHEHTPAHAHTLTLTRTHMADSGWLLSSDEPVYWFGW